VASSSAQRFEPPAPPAAQGSRRYRFTVHSASRLHAGHSVPASGCTRHPVVSSKALEARAPHQGRQHPRRPAGSRSPLRSLQTGHRTDQHRDGRSAPRRRGRGGALHHWAASSVAQLTTTAMLKSRCRPTVAPKGGGGNRIPELPLHPRRRCAGPSDGWPHEARHPAHASLEHRAFHRTDIVITAPFVKPPIKLSRHGSASRSSAEPKHHQAPSRPHAGSVPSCLCQARWLAAPRRLAMHPAPHLPGQPPGDPADRATRSRPSAD